MAYRFEGGDLILDGWEKGISDSPYSISVPSALGPVTQTGTVDLSYGNIGGIPGEFSVQFPLLVSTVSNGAGVGLAVTVHKAVQYSGATVVKYYLLDSKGQIYTSDGTRTAGAITWTYQGHIGSASISTVGNSGMAYWQGYLFTLRDDKIFYSADDGVTNTDWTGTVGSLTGSGSTHYAISSQFSDSMYFCNGSSVGALILNQGKTFDPTDPSTYTYQQSQVRIPSYDFATCLAEINGQVLIGGGLNRVYPWDALNLGGSGVTSLVGFPLFLGDRFVTRIVVMNTNAYIFTGHPIIPTGRGNIYISNGSQVDIFKKMPDNLATLAGSNSDIQEPYWQFGDAMFHRNRLMFGAIAIGNRSGSTITGTGGVWAIDANSMALYRSNLTTAGPSDLVTVISPMDTGTTIPGLGYWSGSSAIMNNTTTTLSTSAVMLSDKIPVGTKFIPKTFEQLELKLAVALVSGESIDVSVYTDLDPTGKSIGSMTSVDGMSKVFTPLALSSSSVQQGLQWLQVKCTLNPTDTNPTYVRLREVRLR